MAARGAHPQLPYAIRVTNAPYGRPPEHHTLSYRKDLRRALRDIDAATTAWSQLIGGQYPGLFWSVVDCRTGEIYRPFLHTKGSASDGTEPKEGGRLF